MVSLSQISGWTHGISDAPGRGKRAILCTSIFMYVYMCVCVGVGVGGQRQACNSVYEHFYV